MNKKKTHRKNPPAPSSAGETVYWPSLNIPKASRAEARGVSATSFGIIKDTATTLRVALSRLADK